MNGTGVCFNNNNIIESFGFERIEVFLECTGANGGLANSGGFVIISRVVQKKTNAFMPEVVCMH